MASLVSAILYKGILSPYNMGPKILLYGSTRKGTSAVCSRLLTDAAEKEEAVKNV